ncbi:hypothetical protein SSP24_02390 [Streptomyces spinoverrucosus]|uniref:DUF4232 domain-containing protein n=1 Tax=Streptomyces spinoverrucosus TaxID=284043 RepID=A0A4Y3V702_9ACTN|nr:DUF4232 domain-containing protein [Streptomyces spinoverrucosus]GEC02584.1 hypothetical protein SSP24_02390 [Streptomyces spinoverrucosus]GHB41978.1 hypothetical protein GCM10010397_10200 [Streptomyces spinoverrucosus]
MTSTSPSAHPSPSTRRPALLVSAVAVLGLLTGCGGAAGGTTSSPPRQPSLTDAAAPMERGTRCHTSELRASVGRVNPGAGQRNYPIVLTNTSSRTCTLYGFPGAAFVDASGKQLGPDPVREGDAPSRVTLAPGDSAWSGLSYTSPEITGARTATPASLLVTPPDERDQLTVRWTGGEVPVAGNESEVSLTVLRAGTGA